MILLSVIVPVYNVQDYIEECLLSILKQIDFNSTELIIVNDGSTDNSLKYINEILKNYSDFKNIIIINQENRGLSAARNSGINISRGEYLAFIDSDDIIIDEYFISIFTVLNSMRPDVIKFKFNTFKTSMCLKEHRLFINSDGIVDIDYDFIINLFNDSSWYAWSHIYKRCLFDQIRFPLGLNFEDVATIPYIYIKCRSMYFINKPLYGYRIRSGSITSSVDDKVVKKNISSLSKILRKLLNDSFVDERFFILYVFFIRVYFSYYIKYNGILGAYAEWKDLKRYSDNIQVDREMFRSTKHFTYYFLYKNFGFFSIFLMEILVNLNSFYKRILK